MSPIVERQHIVLPGDPVRRPDVQKPGGYAAWMAAALAADQDDPCEECGEDGHVVMIRLHPRPDAHRTEARDELVEACSCCAFGPIGKPERGLLARLRSEQAEGDDLDIKVEVMFPDGSWHDGRRF
jgi:hypothetical protein